MKKILITVDNFNKAKKLCADYIEDYCEKNGLSSEEKTDFVYDLGFGDEYLFECLVKDSDIIDEVFFILSDGVEANNDDFYYLIFEPGIDDSYSDSEYSAKEIVLVIASDVSWNDLLSSN